MEQISVQSVQPADVITDFYGAFAYADDKGAVLQRYLDWLKPNGTIFLKFSKQTKVINKHGKEIPITEWIKSQSGVTVTYVHSPAKYNQIIVRKTSPKVMLGKLKYLEGEPLSQIYEEK